MGIRDRYAMVVYVAGQIGWSVPYALLRMTWNDIWPRLKRIKEVVCLVQSHVWMYQYTSTPKYKFGDTEQVFVEEARFCQRCYRREPLSGSRSFAVPTIFSDNLPPDAVA